jgi:hypothetical protein
MLRRMLDNVQERFSSLAPSQNKHISVVCYREPRESKNSAYRSGERSGDWLSGGPIEDRNLSLQAIEKVTILVVSDQDGFDEVTVWKYPARACKGIPAGPNSSSMLAAHYDK